MTVGAAQSYLVILGIGDKADTNWDGSIAVTGANIEILRGWRFTGADSISGTTSWKMSTRTTPSLNPPGPVQENGVIVKISSADDPGHVQCHDHARQLQLFVAGSPVRQSARRS